MRVPYPCNINTVPSAVQKLKHSVHQLISLCLRRCSRHNRFNKRLGGMVTGSTVRRLNWLFIQKDLEKLRTSPYYRNLKDFILLYWQCQCATQEISISLLVAIK